MKIDLLPKPEPVHPLWTAVLTGTAGLLAIANLWAAGTWISSVVQTRTTEAGYRDLEARLPALQRQAAEQQRRETLTRQIDALQKWAASRPDFQSEVHLLSSLLPGRSALLSVQYTGGANYEVKASLPDLESVATYLRALQNDAQVATVTVKSVARQTAAVGITVPPMPTGGVPSTTPPTGGPTPAAPSSGGSRPTAGSTSFVPSLPASGDPSQTWSARLASLLPWSPGVAKASEGPLPEPQDSGAAQPGDGANTQGAGSVPGQTIPQQAVYILDFSVTLGR
ncbi:MAG TPA: hypothetical protein GX517_01450 [Alicyclobacillus sp.]|nr:hypothetical protein [Alicyclobacillus sp.]